MVPEVLQTISEALPSLVHPGRCLNLRTTEKGFFLGLGTAAKLSRSGQICPADKRIWRKVKSFLGSKAIQELRAKKTSGKRPRLTRELAKVFISQFSTASKRLWSQPRQEARKAVNYSRHTRTPGLLEKS